MRRARSSSMRSDVRSRAQLVQLEEIKTSVPRSAAEGRAMCRTASLVRDAEYAAELALQRGAGFDNPTKKVCCQLPGLGIALALDGDASCFRIQHVQQYVQGLHEFVQQIAEVALQPYRARKVERL